MPSRRIAAEIPLPLREGFAKLRDRLGVPTDFPKDVLAAAEAAAKHPRLPAQDLTDLPFVTIDPPGSLDLDQAVLIERRGPGFRVWYAIADVAAFVTPGDQVDAEAHRRGETLYAPNRLTLLHPPQLSQGAASLLPKVVRPALVWQLDLDTDGILLTASVTRALVKSRAKLDYPTVQSDLDAGRAHPMLALLVEVGKLRQQAEIARGGVNLNVPEQEVSAEGSTWKLHYRASLPIENWNAQISLLTGMAAAQMMLDGRVGLLRTLPPAEEGAISRLRRTAASLNHPWAAETSYPDFIRGLDPATPVGATILNAATRLFRGAGYVQFVGDPPADHIHAAVAAPYAHTTAPLRRLIDRYSGEICLSLTAGIPVPDWVLAAMPTLPTEMATASRRAKAYDVGIISLVEALVLLPSLGESFTGTIIDTGPEYGTIQIDNPAVEARVLGPKLTLGERVPATLTKVDVHSGEVIFRAG